MKNISWWHNRSSKRKTMRSLITWIFSHDHTVGVQRRSCDQKSHKSFLTITRSEFKRKTMRSPITWIVSHDHTVGVQKENHAIPNHVNSFSWSHNRSSNKVMWSKSHKSFLKITRSEFKRKTMRSLITWIVSHYHTIGVQTRSCDQNHIRVFSRSHDSWVTVE